MGERGDDAADGAGAWVGVGDDAVGDGEEVGVALADEGDARAEDGAERGDGSLQERCALPGLAEFVAAEASAGAADEDDGLDVLGGGHVGARLEHAMTRAGRGEARG